MARLARTVGSGWVEYKWAHPITNEVKVKNSYLERVGALVVICGIYKQRPPHPARIAQSPRHRCGLRETVRVVPTLGPLLW